MRLVRLSLSNFRNFARLTLDFPRPITVLRGDNAQGKTNLLEAVYFLATSRSPRTNIDRELVNWLAFEEPLPFARLEGEAVRGDALMRIEVTLVQRPNHNSDSVRLTKQIRIDGANRRALDLVGRLPVVLFLPSDINLVTGSPAGRRRYLSATLCQMDAGHCRDLVEYERVLTQRTALLKELRERGARSGHDQLRFWDDRLIALGSRITTRRASHVRALDDQARRQHRGISAGRDSLRLLYRSGIGGSVRRDGEGDEKSDPLNEALAAGDVGRVEALFQERLDRIRRRELAAGLSLAGPHRDDLDFLDNGRDMRAFASRGQQRTATLSIKLAEVAVMTHELGEAPLLLLDDVMSELDNTRRGALLTLLASVPQAIVTATDWDDFSPAFLSQVRRLRVVDGRVEDAGSSSPAGPTQREDA
jgi:DNA replication and repair protein RecF